MFKRLRIDKVWNIMSWCCIKTDLLYLSFEYAKKIDIKDVK